MNQKPLVPALAAWLVFYLLSSCNKIDTTGIGNQLIPAVDNIHSFETVLDVITDNYPMDDSTRIYYNDDHAVGVIAEDPSFGKTAAALYAAFTPAYYGGYPFLNPDSVRIDSVVLSLSYAGLYGDSNALEQFEVYEIDPSAAFSDSAYPIRTPDFAIRPALLGSRLVAFSTLNDSLTYVEATDTVQAGAELRIPLDTSFGRRFVGYDTAHAYKNDSLFKELFKGLAIRINEGMSPAKTALAYFDLGNARTRLSFYCRVTKDGKEDTIAPAFSFHYLADAQANTIRRTAAHGYLSYQNNGHGDNDDLLYIQSAPGSYATIRIPGLDTLDNRVIDKAELIIEPVASAGDGSYAPPSLLFLDAYDSAGKVYRTIQNDFVQNGSGYDFAGFGGYLRHQRYSFDLSRYVQGIVTRHERNFTLRLYAPFLAFPVYVPPGTQSSYDVQALLKAQQSSYGLFAIGVNPEVAAGRVVLGGGSHSVHKMRLRIIYSKI